MVLAYTIANAQPAYKEMNQYKVTNNMRQKNNVVIVINQINQSIKNQPVLKRLINKVESHPTHYTLKSLINNLIKQQYQIVFVTHHPYTYLFQPDLLNVHLYVPYQLRFNKKRLNEERNIFSSSMRHIDSYVSKEQYWRPLCIIFELPKESNYSLDEKLSVIGPQFNNGRDFSLINAYHEIHRRKYLYPTNFVIYSTVRASQGLVLLSQK